MKVRFGIGAVSAGSAYAMTGEDLVAYARDAEDRGIDSIWLPDLVSGAHAVDPLVGMSWVAATTRTLKVGAGAIVLPGRNPVLLASQLASMAALAPKRILPTFGLRAALPADRGGYAVTGPRAEVFDESIEVVRALLTQDAVTYHGQHFQLDGVTVAPRPARPIDLWLGGRAPAALRRAGQLSDGWLGSFLTPDEAADCRRQIAAAALEAGRTIDDDHYGTYLLVAADDGAADATDVALALIARQRPDLDDPTQLVSRGWAQAREQAQRHLDGGITKFVVSPAGPVRSRTAFMDGVVTELMPLQN